MRFHLGALIAVSLITAAVLGGQPARAENIDSPNTAWIYGKTYRGVDSGFCLSKALAKQEHRLQFRNSQGRWKTVAVSKPSWSKKSKRCKAQYPKFPYKLKWRFTVSELGDPVRGESNKYRLQVRESMSDGDKNLFTKTVYPSRQAHAEMFADTLDDLLKGAI